MRGSWVRVPWAAFVFPLFELGYRQDSNYAQECSWTPVGLRPPPDSPRLLIIYSSDCSCHDFSMSASHNEIRPSGSPALHQFLLRIEDSPLREELMSLRVAAYEIVSRGMDSTTKDPHSIYEQMGLRLGL